jgi:hypothetical protein
LEYEKMREYVLAGKRDQLWNVIPESIYTPEELQAYIRRLQLNLNSRDSWIRYFSGRTLAALTEQHQATFVLLDNSSVAAHVSQSVNKGGHLARICFSRRQVKESDCWHCRRLLRARHHWPCSRASKTRNESRRRIHPSPSSAGFDALFMKARSTDCVEWRSNDNPTGGLSRVSSCREAHFSFTGRSDTRD